MDADQVNTINIQSILLQSNTPKGSAYLNVYYNQSDYNITLYVIIIIRFVLYPTKFEKSFALLGILYK